MSFLFGLDHSYSILNLKGTFKLLWFYWTMCSCRQDPPQQMIKRFQEYKPSRALISIVAHLEEE